jgi:imidazoleglycerol-phosphate dehydratase
LAGLVNTLSGFEMPRSGMMEVSMERQATVERKTKETDIFLRLDIDGNGKGEVDTGIGFLDHMLEGFARHGFFNLEVKVKGDLHVDGHHTVEDVGIVLGQAVKGALGNKTGIRRYGSFILPMDDALVLCAVDLCGRPYFSYECEFPAERIGGLDTELIREFFYAVSYSAGMNLHIKMISGINSHHMAEAMFKSFAKALDEAAGKDGRLRDVLSTKGSLA